MNKTISVLRISLLLSLAVVGLVLLFGEEQDADIRAWMCHLFIDKSLSILMLASSGVLYARWSRVDPWLKACNRMCREVAETRSQL